MALQSNQTNTVLMNNLSTSFNVLLGTPLLDMSKAEVVWSVRTDQSIQNPFNHSINVQLISLTQVNVRRGGAAGTLTVTFTVIERLASSPVIVDRGSGNLSGNPKNILLPSRTQANRYSRVGVYGSTVSTLESYFVTHSVTSDTNLLITGDLSSFDIEFDWQTVFDPGQTVHNHTATATGTSFNINITADSIIKEETFVVQSMRNIGTVSAGIDGDEFKAANISSDINLEIYSLFGDTHTSLTQLVHRPANKVQRTDTTTTLNLVTITVGAAYVVADTFVSMGNPNQYRAPTLVTLPNNAQDFNYVAEIDNTTQHTIRRFLGGKSTRIITEIIEIDSNPVLTGHDQFYRMNRRRR